MRGIRDSCVMADVPFFYKQDAEKGRNRSLPKLDGRRWAEFPQP